MRKVFSTLCIMAGMAGCGQAANKFSREQKIAVLDTLANNFSTQIAGWATEKDPGNELVIVSMSLISDPRLLGEYKERGGISNMPGKTRIDEYVRLKIEDYSLIDENNDSLKIELTDTTDFYFDGYFAFTGHTLGEKNNELYFNHVTKLNLNAAFRQLKGYITVVVYFPEKEMERKVRVPVHVSVSDN